MQQGDRHRLGVGRDPVGCRRIERHQDLTVHREAARDPDAVVAVDERGRTPHRIVVEEWPVLAGDLDDVLEPLGAQQRHHGVEAFEDGVGRDRGAVGKGPNGEAPHRPMRRHLPGRPASTEPW